MKKVFSGVDVIKGIDIYHGDRISDINQVKTYASFCFLKASEGTSIVDPSFKARWSELKTAGIIRGAYHFFHPSADPIAQATHFCNVVGILDSGDLPCVLDWESSDGVPSIKDATAGMKFLSKVRELTGKKPIIYGSPYFLKDLNLQAGYPLWVANYGVSAPLIPDPWVRWTFWQNSEAAPVPGMNGHCDTDVFNGTIDDLRVFIRAS